MTKHLIDGEGKQQPDQMNVAIFKWQVRAARVLVAIQASSGMHGCASPFSCVGFSRLLHRMFLA
jgi:hypothetical protein